MSQTTTPIEFATEPASGRIGATLRSVDLDTLLADPAQQQRLRDALLEHLVVGGPRRGTTPPPPQGHGPGLGVPEPPAGIKPPQPRPTQISG